MDEFTLYFLFLDYSERKLFRELALNDFSRPFLPWNTTGVSLFQHQRLLKFV